MARKRRDAEAELNLPPGFRFHPTDEELVVFYLARKAAKELLPAPIIADVDLYKYDPWLLPEKALFGHKEWYFFTPRDRKYPNGTRPNRAAGGGYWKATGADKPVIPEGSSKPLGIKKALVFYAGKAPNGAKTNWIMHEYRLADVDRSARRKGSLRLDDWVLCRLYNKKNNWQQEMQQRSAEDGTSTCVDMVDSLKGEPSGGHRSPEPYANSTIAHRQGGDVTTGAIFERAGENPDWFAGFNADFHTGPFAAAAGLDAHAYQGLYFIPPAPARLPCNVGNRAPPS